MPVPSEWIGQKFSRVRAQASTLLLGLVHANEVILGVAQDPEVAAEDSVLMLIPSR
jgi:hypothetical protein